jgi:N-acylneuraminate cytidylyltransferase/CMP-N,N'-diacetyllegionaminic acid synthase
MSNNILWLIPARSGSKSIPHKNIKKLGDYPLIAYRIKSALSIASPEDVWVSTDSEEYAEIAQRYGATIPFIRPAELATETATSADVVLHAINEAEMRGLKYNVLGLLEPTSPFVRYSQLAEAAQQLIGDNEAENIVAVRESRPNSFFIQKNSKYLSELAERLSMVQSHARQNFGKEITPSGGFHMARWDSFKRSKTFFTPKTLSYFVGPENELEIDEPLDWNFAEFILRNGFIKINDIFII